MMSISRFRLRAPSSFLSFTTTAAPSVKSKRAKFREIEPSASMLDHLDALRLGYCATRRMRVQVARKWEGRAGIDGSGSGSGSGSSRSGDRLHKRSVRAAIGRSKEEGEGEAENEKKIKPRHSPDLTSRPFPFSFLGRPILRTSRWEDLPLQVKGGPPEVAVIGRSNVGKSTLVNALLGYDQSFVQRTAVSDKPGETNHLHFYGLGRGSPGAVDFSYPDYISNRKTIKIEKEKQHQQIVSLRTPAAITPGSTYNNNNNNNTKSKKGDSSISVGPLPLPPLPRPPAMVLVDMPGYGFASMSNEDKARCEALTSMYLRERGSTLKRVILLLDARHGFKAGETEFFKQLLTKKKQEPILVHNNTTSIHKTNNINNTAQSQPVEELSQADNDNKENFRISDRLTRVPFKEASKMRWKLQIVLTKCDLVERTGMWVGMWVAYRGGTFIIIFLLFPFSFIYFRIFHPTLPLPLPPPFLI